MRPPTAEDTTEACVLAGFEPLSAECWPRPGEDGSPPPLGGFVGSDFSPMVAAAADRCLAPVYGPVEADRPARRTALVLASAGGDLQTYTATARLVTAGRRPSPLLFFQSVPNAVLGQVARCWGLTGPVICLSPDQGRRPLAEALEVAGWLTATGSATEALLLVVDQVLPSGAPGTVQALLVRPTGHPA